MWRVASLALLLTSLTPCLVAQRGGAAFHGVVRPNARSGHLTQRPFSSRQFARRSHHSDGLGAFWSPYFPPDGQSYWSETSEPQASAPEPAPERTYARSGQERTPADAQLIEIPAAANQNQLKPPVPAMFVLTNGERIETQRFLLTASTLSVSIDRHERVIPLEAVDVTATTAANRERGINLRIPADHNEISLGF